MVVITNILLLAATASAAVLRRDYETIQGDASTINSDVVALKRDAKAFDGDLSKAVTLTSKAADVDSDIKAMIHDAKNSNELSDSETSELLDYINTTIEPNVRQAIKSIEQKKEKFEEELLAQNVVAALKVLQADSAALADALENIAPGAEDAVDVIVDDIQDGVDYYVN